MDSAPAGPPSATNTTRTTTSSNAAAPPPPPPPSSAAQPQAPVKPADGTAALLQVRLNYIPTPMSDGIPTPLPNGSSPCDERTITRYLQQLSHPSVSDLYVKNPSWLPESVLKETCGGVVPESVVFLAGAQFRALPSGYVLIEIPRITDRKHKDKYLLGHASGVNEFKPHLIWLIGLKSGDCTCFACNGGKRTSLSGTQSSPLTPKSSVSKGSFVASDKGAAKRKEKELLAPFSKKIKPNEVVVPAPVSAGPQDPFLPSNHVHAPASKKAKPATGTEISEFGKTHRARIIEIIRSDIHNASIARVAEELTKELSIDLEPIRASFLADVNAIFVGLANDDASIRESLLKAVKDVSPVAKSSKAKPLNTGKPAGPVSAPVAKAADSIGAKRTTNPDGTNSGSGDPMDVDLGGGGFGIGGSVGGHGDSGGGGSGSGVGGAGGMGGDPGTGELKQKAPKPKPIPRYRKYDVVWVEVLLDLKDKPPSIPCLLPSSNDKDAPLTLQQLDIRALHEDTIFWPAVIAEVMMPPYEDNLWGSPVVIDTLKREINVGTTGFFKEDVNVKRPAYRIRLLQIAEVLVPVPEIYITPYSVIAPPTHLVLQDPVRQLEPYQHDGVNGNRMPDNVVIWYLRALAQAVEHSRACVNLAAVPQVVDGGVVTPQPFEFQLGAEVLLQGDTVLVISPVRKGDRKGPMEHNIFVLDSVTRNPETGEIEIGAAVTKTEEKFDPKENRNTVVYRMGKGRARIVQIAWTDIVGRFYSFFPTVHELVNTPWFPRSSEVTVGTEIIEAKRVSF